MTSSASSGHHALDSRCSILPVQDRHVGEISNTVPEEEGDSPDGREEEGEHEEVGGL